MVNTKRESYRLMGLGMYGNEIGKWDTTNYNSIPDGIGVTIRTNRAGGGFCKYVRPEETWVDTQLEIGSHIIDARLVGYKDNEIYMTELMPDQEIVMQGEYHELYGCYYSTEKLHMREVSLNQYCRTRHVIRQAMCEHSYEHFMGLVKDYPDHVIEFSVYNVPVGSLRWNTMIWEVRNY